MRASSHPFIFGLVLRNETTAQLVRDLYLFISEPKVLLSQLNGEIIRFKPGKSQAYTYRRKELHLLKPPYRTRCRQFRNRFYSSKVQCIQLCSKRQAIESGSIPDDIILRDTAKNRGLNLKFSGQSNTSFPSFSRYCNQKCHQLPCQLVEYVSKFQIEYDDGKTIFFLSLPSESDVNVVYSPELPIGEFLALMASVLGFWFNFNIASMVVIGYAIKRKMSRIN